MFRTIFAASPAKMLIEIQNGQSALNMGKLEMDHKALSDILTKFLDAKALKETDSVSFDLKCVDLRENYEEYYEEDIDESIAMLQGEVDRLYDSIVRTKRRDASLSERVNTDANFERNLTAGLDKFIAICLTSEMEVKLILEDFKRLTNSIEPQKTLDSIVVINATEMEKSFNKAHDVLYKYTPQEVAKANMEIAIKHLYNTIAQFTLVKKNSEDPAMVAEAEAQLPGLEAQYAMLTSLSASDLAVVMKDMYKEQLVNDLSTLINTVKNVKVAGMTHKLKDAVGDRPLTKEENIILSAIFSNKIAKALAKLAEFCENVCGPNLAISLVYTLFGTPYLTDKIVIHLNPEMEEAIKKMRQPVDASGALDKLEDMFTPEEKAGADLSVGVDKVDLSEVTKMIGDEDGDEYATSCACGPECEQCTCSE